MRVILGHTVVNIFVVLSLCLLHLSDSSSRFVSACCISLWSLSLSPFLLVFCQAFILHCALFTATFSVDFLTPDFLIGIQYFRYVHYAFKCELSALLPPVAIRRSFVRHALFIYYSAWPLANCKRTAQNARKFNVSLGKLKLNLNKRNEFINIRGNCVSRYSSFDWVVCLFPKYNWRQRHAAFPNFLSRIRQISSEPQLFERFAKPTCIII